MKWMETFKPAETSVIMKCKAFGCHLAMSVDISACYIAPPDL